MTVSYALRTWYKNTRFPAPVEPATARPRIVNVPPPLLRSIPYPTKNGRHPTEPKPHCAHGAKPTRAHFSIKIEHSPQAVCAQVCLDPCGTGSLHLRLSKSRPARLIRKNPDRVHIKRTQKDSGFFAECMHVRKTGMAGSAGDVSISILMPHTFTHRLS